MGKNFDSFFLRVVLALILAMLVEGNVNLSLRPTQFPTEWPASFWPGWITPHWFPVSTPAENNMTSVVKSVPSNIPGTKSLPITTALPAVTGAANGMQEDRTLGDFLNLFRPSRNCPVCPSCVTCPTCPSCTTCQTVPTCPVAPTAPTFTRCVTGENTVASAAPTGNIDYTGGMARPCTYVIVAYPSNSKIRVNCPTVTGFNPQTFGDPGNSAITTIVQNVEFTTVGNVAVVHVVIPNDSVPGSTLKCSWTAIP